jgi:hypothetical protein
MAEIVQHPQVEVTATMQFNEAELRALDALVGYGIDGFLQAFYAKLGKHYLQPHEDGLRLLFKSVSANVPGILGRTDDARRVFTGERITTHRPKYLPSGVIGQDDGISYAHIPSGLKGKAGKVATS